MDEFLETQKLQTMTEEETEIVKGSVTSKEIGSVIKNLPTEKNTGSDGFITKFYLPRI